MNRRVSSSKLLSHSEPYANLCAAQGVLSDHPKGRAPGSLVTGEERAP